MRKRFSKKRAAALTLSLYLLANGLVLGMIHVSMKSYNTMHRAQISAASLQRAEDGYLVSVLYYSATVKTDRLEKIKAQYRKAAPLLPGTARAAVDCFLHLTAN